MSQQKRDWGVDEPFSEDAVVDYLSRHPEFFEHQPQTLANLKLSHPTGGAAVSLVERQVSVLRQKNTELERKLKELIAVAKTNDTLVQNMHDLAIQLLDAADLSSRLVALEAVMREQFAADHAVLVLFEDVAAGEASAGRFLRVVSRDDPGLSPFKTFLGTSKPRCGQMRDSQRSFLFKHAEEEIGSVAMLPLGTKCELGFLVIGNADREHFHPAKSIDFLERIGELVAVALGGRA